MSTKIQSIKGQREEYDSIFGDDYDVFENTDELLICGEVVRHFFPRRKKTPDIVVIKAHLTSKQSKAKRGWMKIEIIGQLDSHNYEGNYDWKKFDEDEIHDMYLSMGDTIDRKFPEVRARIRAGKRVYMFLRIEESK